MKKIWLLFLFAALSGVVVSGQNTWNVPTDFGTIQEALLQAQEGDTVLVAPGIYPEKIHFQGRDVVLASHFIRTGDTHYINQTIIQGDTTGALVRFDQGETAAAQLIGFSLRGGGEGFPEDVFNVPVFSGVIECEQASPTIRHNQILDSYYFTGPYYNYGVIYCHQSAAVIERNRIDGLAGFFVSRLAGILARHSDLTIRHNQILNGGGGYILGPAGAIVADTSVINAHHNILAAFTADGYPAAGLVLTRSQADLRHLTITQNLAGLVLNDSCQVQLTNTILYGTNGTLLPGWNGIIDLFGEENELSVTYSDIHGSWPGEGNINEDPRWIDEEQQDFHLSPDSPCIDAGDPGSAPDPDGTRADMGALHFPQSNALAPGLSQPLSFEVYPNPARRELWIVTAEEQKLNIRLLDLQGREVIPPRPYRPDQPLTLTLPAGTYFLQAWVKDGKAGLKKLVID